MLLGPRLVSEPCSFGVSDADGTIAVPEVGHQRDCEAKDVEQDGHVVFKG